MVRPRRCRRIWFRGGFHYFKPQGIRAIDLDETILTVDEFEAIRLKDLKELDQKEAAKKMNISQPTFQRLLQEARKKIADAIVNGKAIRIYGGVVKMPGGDRRGPLGPRGRGRGFGFGGPAMNCVCPSCGATVPKTRRLPCAQMKCPKCGSVMARE